MEDALTAYKASQLCDVSSKAIINWIDAGRIKACKTVGGHRRIKRNDLSEFIQRQGIPIPEDYQPDNRRKILVVDDDPIVVSTIMRALKEDEHDYEVIRAAEGFEAGLQVNRLRPDLMILNIMMPDIKGNEACKIIKSDPDTENSVSIVLSAFPDEDKFNEPTSCGADICFPKPLPRPQIREEVARLLES